MTIAAAFTAAWLLGLLTQRLSLSPIVGYLIAGIVIGPYTPGFVGDIQIAQQLAEVGIILLMFGVGLHFHVKDLLAVRGVAVPGAVGQSAVATVLAMLIFSALGLPVKTGAVLGMAMAVASTVVLMRVLMDADALNSSEGHVAVGWLLVEDVFTVVVLILIPVLGSGQASASGLLVALALALLKLAALVAMVMVFGAKAVPWVMVQVARLRSRELFTLTVLVFSVAIAAGAYVVFGASMALGAFLAGMMVAQSPVSHQAAADALPLRDSFAVIFFVSVGMLFDPRFIIQEPLMILTALGIILIAKPLSALIIVAALGHSGRTAITVALGLAQIGEFSFILSELGRNHHLMPDAGHSVLVASAIISITLNPMLFRSLPRLETWLRARPRLWNLLNGRAEARSRKMNLSASGKVQERPTAGDHLAIVVGFGPVGRSVHTLLKDAGLSTCVIDLNMDTVSRLNSEDQPAIFGDASHESILEQAGMRRAKHLVVTLPHVTDRVAVVTAARNLNAKARILVRAHYLRERRDLEQVGATAAVFEEEEAAVGLARLVLVDTGARREVAERKVRDLRMQLILDNMSNIHAQRVRSVMVPWSRVGRLSNKLTHEQVLRQVASQRFSRWPVTDAETGRVTGYLLTKDLIAAAAGRDDWLKLVRPAHIVGPEDTIESTLLRTQQEGVTVWIVEEAGMPVGMITIEDVLEQIVGRIEDEYPREARVTLRSTVQDGGILLDVRGRTREQVIQELAAAIPAQRLTNGADIVELALAREAEVSTDLGTGVAVPHARVPGLTTPFVVFGRSREGIMFSPQSSELVRLVFLLITPTHEPEVQLSLLAQVVSAVSNPTTREELLAACSPSEVLDALVETQHATAAR
ncbi:MAG: hypothetical protein AMXMBFR13_38100 [Phycisphaerae bacterium]